MAYLAADRLLKQRNSLLPSCTHHPIPAPTQAELGDFMAPRKSRGSWVKAGMGSQGRGLSRVKQPLQNDQGDKGVGESLVPLAGLLLWDRSTLTPPMDLLLQDQCPLLARNLPD